MPDSWLALILFTTVVAAQCSKWPMQMNIYWKNLVKMYGFSEQFDSYLVVYMCMVCCLWCAMWIVSIGLAKAIWNYRSILPNTIYIRLPSNQNGKATLYLLHLQDVQCEMLSVNRDESTRLASQLLVCLYLEWSCLVVVLVCSSKIETHCLVLEIVVGTFRNKSALSTQFYSVFQANECLLVCCSANLQMFHLMRSKYNRAMFTLCLWGNILVYHYSCSIIVPFINNSNSKQTREMSEYMANPTITPMIEHNTLSFNKFCQESTSHFALNQILKSQHNFWLQWLRKRRFSFECKIRGYYQLKDWLIYTRGGQCPIKAPS